MLAKVVGEFDGAYTEQTYEKIIKHRVSFCDVTDMSDGDVFSGGDSGFLRLTLFYSKTEFEYVYFNTVCYLMEDSGVTVDILTHDKMMKKRR